jgi:hypothetical protein
VLSVVFPLTDILALVGPELRAEAVDLVLVKTPGILAAVCPDNFPVPGLHALNELSDVSCSVG